MSSPNVDKPRGDTPVLGRIIRVLVIDDSAYVRKVIKEILSRSPLVEVVGIARDGKEALELVEQLHPDVVTLDLIMPEMDGVQFLQAQMAKQPIPAIVVSITDENTAMGVAALEAGAIDFVQKPTALATERIFEIREELLNKVKAAASISMTKSPLLTTLTPPSLAAMPHPLATKFDVVVIGVSTGGPQALSFLLPQLPADFPVPIAIVLHMPIGYTALYAERLNQSTALQVIEAHGDETLRPGQVILAQAGQHLSFVRRSDGQVMTHLDARPFDTLHRPSVDVLFQSAAEVFGDRVLGIVLTGMGNDGKQGAAWIKAQGGTILTEAEETCVVYGMPRCVAEAGLSDRAVPLNQIISAILEAL